MPEIDEQVEQAEAAGAAATPEEEAERTRWDFEDGAEIVPGRYALRKLGGGYDFEAYLAWDDKLHALVVAKCLRPHLVDDAHALSSLKREGEMVLRLNHPVVVRGFDVVDDGPRPHLILEHLEGPNLASLLRRFGPLQLEQLLPLMLQICSAIHYLGTEELVHLDIKPRNIIMGAPPRLIDMSIARSFARAKRITGTVGTDAYMSPEQCDPTRAEIGPAADIWGLGATLHHALAGKVPFPRPDYDKERDKDNPALRWPQLTEDRQPLPKGVPPMLVDLIATCLDMGPDKRPTPAHIVDTIEPMIAALPTKPVLRRARPGRRRT